MPGITAHAGRSGVSCPIPGPTRGILARMTSTDHRAAALAALEAARVARVQVADEYAKPTGRRDYNLIGELRAAAKMCQAEALVYATLYAGDQANLTHPNIPTTVVVTDNAHDALQAARGVRVLLAEAADEAQQQLRPKGVRRGGPC